MAERNTTPEIPYDKIVDVLRTVDVRDRTYRLKTYRKCFVGSDMVDILLRRGYAESRAEAVNLARQTAARYDLFAHVYGAHELKDEFLFYRFKIHGDVYPSEASSSDDDNSSEASVDISGNEKSLIEAFSQVEVKDRRWRLLSYEKCFIGSEAVDLLVTRRLASSRRQAVKIGRLLASEYNLFEHVTRDHDFSDSYLFYRFKPNMPDVSMDVILEAMHTVDVQDRTWRLNTYPKCFVGSEMIDLLINLGYAKTRAEALNIGRYAASRFDMFAHVCGAHELKDEYLFYRFKIHGDVALCDASGSGRDDESTICDAGMEAFQLNPNDEELINALKQVEVKDRRWRLKVYEKCFIGSEAVDLLVTKRFAASRGQAVKIGRILASQCDLFQHVTRDHDFSDDYLFYRFKSDAAKLKPVFDMAEVERHCSDEKGHWIVINNRVYNCTDYVRSHPGGAKLITDVSGTDATVAFQSPYTHSATARNMLEKYYIGDLKEADQVFHVQRPAAEISIDSRPRQEAEEQEEEEKEEDNDEDEISDEWSYSSDKSVDMTTSLLAEDFDIDCEENAAPSPRETVSKILWVRRLFPEVHGRLLVCRDKEGKIRDGEEFTFCLSRGILRRGIVTSSRETESDDENEQEQSGSDSDQEPRSAGSDNSKKHSETRASLRRSDTMHDVLTHFLLWDCRRVDVLGIVSSEDQKSDEFHCAGWTLAPLEETSSSVESRSPSDGCVQRKSAVLSEWKSAISATRKLLISPLWRQVETDLTVIASGILVQCQGYLPVAPVGIVIRYLRAQFDLPPLFAKELLHALVDAGLLVPKPYLGGFGFCNSLSRLRMLFPALSKEQQKSLLEKKRASLGAEVLRTDTEVCDETALDEGSLLSQDRFHEALCRQERVLQCQGMNDSEMLQFSCDVSKKSFDQSANSSSYDQRIRLRRSFDIMHLDADEDDGHENHKPARCISHSFPCHYTAQKLPQPYEIWPQRPLLLRPTPGSGTRILGIRFSSSEKYLFLSGSGFCSGCTLPINNGTESRGKSLVIDFQTELFKGTMLVRVKHAKGAVLSSQVDRQDYFKSKKRTLQVVIRGQFTEDKVPVSECVTGQVFSSSWEFIRPKWMLRSTVNLLSVSSCHLKDFASRQPQILCPLAGSANSVVVEKKKEKANLENNIEDKLEEKWGGKSLLHGVKEIDKSILYDPTDHKRIRKKVFNKTHTRLAEGIKFQRNKVYTFEWYNGIVDFDDFSLDMGPCGQHKLAGVLNGQPLQIMAARNVGDMDNMSLQYLWSFDLWHESLYHMAKSNLVCS